MRLDRDRAGEFLARAFVGMLFLLLSWTILNDFLRTGHVTGLLLLVSELLVVVLTIARRPARHVDRSLAARAMTMISIAGPPLLRPGTLHGLLPDLATAVISGVGLLIVIVGKVTLGRSFGVVPADRGIVVGGPYALVRHPIYTGYLITHAAFVVAHPHLWNVVVVAIADAALIVRALCEERVLSRDDGYRAYCRRVGWHLVPGVF
jgi:protein-S-isoprenylcysteine O-methyltransferase Ste14